MNLKKITQSDITNYTAEIEEKLAKEKIEREKVDVYTEKMIRAARGNSESSRAFYYECMKYSEQGYIAISKEQLFEIEPPLKTVALIGRISSYFAISLWIGFLTIFFYFDVFSPEFFSLAVVSTGIWFFIQHGIACKICRISLSIWKKKQSRETINLSDEPLEGVKA